MRRLLALTLGAAAAASPAAAQETATFLLRRDGETVAAERFTRTPGRLVVERSAERGGLLRWQAELTADGRVSRLRLEIRLPGDTAGTGRLVSARFVGDSAAIETVRGDSVERRRVAAPRGALPWIDGSIVMAEQAMRHALAVGGGELTVPVVRLPDGIVDSILLHPSGDSSRVVTSTGTLLVRADELGSILGGEAAREGLAIVRWAGHVAPLFEPRPPEPPPSNDAEASARATPASARSTGDSSSTCCR